MIRIRQSPALRSAIAQTRASSTQHAFAVIVGGGMAGSSCAYHLTQRNIKDVVLLEKEHVASPAATSYHSPGLVSAAHPAHRYKPILAYSCELYAKLDKESGEPINFSRPGTLRLATNQTRLAEFRKYTARDYYKEGDVCKTTLLTPEQVAEMVPHLDKKEILGGLYTSNDGYVNSKGLNKAFVNGAKSRGASVVNQTIPDFIRYDKGTGEWLVGLGDGSLIKTRNIINAGGIWANDIARLSGHSIPMIVVEHQYAVVKPTEQLKAGLPAIIDHDSTFYVRQSGDELLFGGFEMIDRVKIREDWFKNGVPKDGSASITPDFERLSRAYERAKELLPAMRDAKVDARAAVFSMTPDGYPLVGPFDKNYWVSTGFLDGVSSAGGLGKYLADWIVDGEPPAELFDTDASRYDGWADRKFIVDKGVETYSMFYNWSYTDRLAARPTDRISGVYGLLKKQGAQFGYRNGWEVAQYFNIDEENVLSTLEREYLMVTNKCGVIDMSWKGKIEVKGPDAQELLEYAVCGEVPALGKIGSGLMLTRAGRVLAPLKIFHHDSVRSQFILLTEPERESRDLYWLKRAAAEKQFKVQVHSVSEYLASLALVGPKSRELLQLLTKSEVSDEGFPQRSTKLMRLGAAAVVCARSSTSTGQLSYELFHNRADSKKLYEAIMAAGRPLGIVNFGQATMNGMRLEHGFKIWGRELTLDTNPFECGLGALVDLKSGKDFIGKASSIEHATQTFNRRLALITMDTDSVVPAGNEVLRREGEEERIGQVTSAGYSARLQKPIAFAWLDSSVKVRIRMPSTSTSVVASEYAPPSSPRPSSSRSTNFPHWVCHFCRLRKVAQPHHTLIPSFVFNLV
uniref:FAD dependent oxidoreductase n=1 Tax=Pristionchus pacificus TaxID=54126 RepID=A0A8R1Z4D7_PRIPA